MSPFLGRGDESVEKTSLLGQPPASSGHQRRAGERESPLAARWPLQAEGRSQCRGMDSRTPPEGCRRSFGGSQLFQQQQNPKRQRLASFRPRMLPSVLVSVVPAAKRSSPASLSHGCGSGTRGHSARMRESSHVLPDRSIGLVAGTTRTGRRGVRTNHHWRPRSDSPATPVATQRVTLSATSSGFIPYPDRNPR